jgi:hypothetical protein
MSSYYLGRFIPFDSARAGVPAGDQAIRAQHVDGVVKYSVYQESEALFTLALVLLLIPALLSNPA